MKLIFVNNAGSIGTQNYVGAETGEENVEKYLSDFSKAGMVLFADGYFISRSPSLILIFR